MIGFDPVFLDTVAFIYLVENNTKYAPRISKFLTDEISQKENLLMTSVLTISEFSVKPIRDEDNDLLRDFLQVLKSLQFQVFDITIKVANTAAELRAKYKSLKTVDSLQISCAINYGCKRFLTNDFRLKNITEIQVILIDELIN